MKKERSVAYPPVRGEVAIIGMGCTFPGARNAEKFWQNIINKVSAITEVSPKYWDPAVFYDPDPNNDRDRLYFKKGGWIGDTFSFNPLKFGIPPTGVVGSEPDHFLLMRCVYEALEDAGYLNQDYDRQRVSVVVGKGNYAGPGLLWLAVRTNMMASMMSLVRHLRPDLSEEKLNHLQNLLKSQLPRLTPEMAGGIIPNIATGRVANRFDFMGRNFSIDAACASALTATEIAVQNLLTGVDDMSLVGGVHIFNQLPFLSIFRVTRAISLTEVARPFDAKADGTMCGEGIGMLVLKRLADAECDGDRIYAVIKGIGSSSDGKAKAVMAPRAEGESLAIQRALEMSELPPETVGLVECHGTATVVGDAVEIEALETSYGPAGITGPSCAIGSVKSMIGHTMPAAGAAGLIKTAMALYHRVLPPTMNVTEPHPMLRDPNCRFYVNTETKPWIQRTDGPPRRAAVSAFGFGGINVHMVMEEYTKADQTKQPSHLRTWECELVVVEGETREALTASLDRLRRYAVDVEGVALRDVAYTVNAGLRGLAQRVSIVATSLEDLAEKIDRVKAKLADPHCTHVRERSGVYYFDEAELRAGKIAFLFPGEGAQYLNMMADLCIHFPEARVCFDYGDSTVKDPARIPLSSLVYPPPAFSKKEEAALEARLFSIEDGTKTVLTADWAMVSLLEKLGIQADMVTGHSIGEWMAMGATGVIDMMEFVDQMQWFDEVFKKVKQDTGLPKAAMLAVGAGRERILQFAEETGCKVEIANDNCPHQVVVVVSLDQVEPFSEHLLKSGVFVERLPYDFAYHTPGFTTINEPIRKFFKALHLRSPRIPVYSCATMEPYPQDESGILHNLEYTFALPLLFSQTIERMYKDGARIFVEAGPRGNLSAFVDDILRGRPHLAIPMDVPRRRGIPSLCHALGMLAAAHVPFSFDPLYQRRSPLKLTLDAKKDSVLPEEKQPGVVQVSKCYMFLDPPEEEFPLPQAAVPPAAVEGISVNGYSTNGPTANGYTGNGYAVPPAPEALPFEPASAGVPASPSAFSMPAASAPGQIPPSVITDHFSLMDDFLRTQEEIMGRMLGASAGYVPMTGHVSEPLPPMPPMAVPRPSNHNFEPAPVAAPTAAPAVQPEALIQSAPIAAPAVVAPPPAIAAPAPAKQDFQALLLSIVSERTGYPPEMLGLDQDMEADLGIDSIKRVEILGALRERAGEEALAGGGDMEAIVKLKTLRQVLEILKSSQGATGQAATGQGATAQTAAAPRQLPPADAPAPIRTMIRTATVVDEKPGESLTLSMKVELEEHRYLLDHGLSFFSTERENQANRLYIVPLTGIVEMMCEAAGLLLPGSKVIGASNVQALRPLHVIVNETPPAIQVTAVRQGPAEVRVNIREDKTGGSVYSQGVVRLAQDYPAAPPVEDLILEHPKTPRVTRKDIYTKRYMFHGPSFHGVRTMDAVGENGMLATLEILPAAGTFASELDPKFHIDPFAFDVLGQFAGYWPVEYCDRGYLLLPIMVGEVTKYCDNPPAGTVVNCQMRVTNLTDRTLRVNHEARLPDGRLWLRVTGWEDWRFYPKPRLFNFTRFPNREYTSVPFTIPALEAAGYECRFLGAMGEMERDATMDEIWTRTVLNRQEHAEFHRRLPIHQRTEWLFLRTSGKDAVRAWAERSHNRKIFPADIEVATHPDSSVKVAGFWTEQIGIPQVSACFYNGWSAAVAGPGRSIIAGIDAAAAIPPHSFLPDEEAWLGRLPDPEEWKRRAVAAKQAGSRYLRPGAAEDSWQTVVIVLIDLKDGSIGVADPGSAVNAEDALRVITAREQDSIVAVAFQP